MAEDWARRLKGAVIQVAGWFGAGGVAMSRGSAGFVRENGRVLGVDGKLPCLTIRMTILN
jgi:hypothetical protein